MTIVGSGGGAVSVRVRCTIRCFRFGAQSGSHAPVSTPCPPNRTCGFPASGSPVGSCLSHNGAPVRSGPSRYRRLCVAPAPRSCTASPAVPLSDLPPSLFTPRRHRAAKPASPAPSLTHVMLRDSLPFQAGIVGKATPAGLRPFVISPHLRPLSSTGVTPRLQYYWPLRHPAGPACPSRGPGRRVHGTARASRVATLSIFHACRRQYPGGNRPVRSSLSSQPVGGLPPDYRRVGFRAKRFKACSAFTRVPACMVAEPPIGGPSLQGASAHVVTSMNRPGRYQPERQLLGGVRTHKENAPFHGAR